MGWIGALISACWAGLLLAAKAITAVTSNVTGTNNAPSITVTPFTKSSVARRACRQGALPGADGLDQLLESHKRAPANLGDAVQASRRRTGVKAAEFLKVRPDRNADRRFESG